MSRITPTLRRAIAVSAVASTALALAACGGGSGSGSDGNVGVTVITKDSSNPFFVAMQKGAKADASKNKVDLTVASGKQEGDDAGQITAIEDSIARGDEGSSSRP